jgi:hypothetical protein
VGEIKSPQLRKVALKIVSAPGFSTDQQGLRRALQQWFTAITGPERIAAEQAFVIRWLEDVHAEYLRDLEREMRATRTIATPHKPAVDDRAEAEAGASSGAEASDGAEPLAPVSVLKFRSESADYSPAALPAQQTVTPSSALTREAPRMPAVATVTTLPNRPAPRVPLAVDPVWQQPDPVPGRAAPVQQRSRKVEGYRRMFPELSSTVALSGGVKPRGKFTPEDIDERVDQIRKQVQLWRTANAGDRARIEGRLKLNAREQLSITEREQNIRLLTAEEDQLAAAKPAIMEAGCGTLDGLPDDVLVECGFQRYAA